MALRPRSDARVDAASPDLQVVVLNSEGYTSSLAAVALHEVGIPRATDVARCYAGWREAGFPTVPGGTPAGRRSPTESPTQTESPTPTEEHP